MEGSGKYGVHEECEFFPQSPTMAHDASTYLSKMSVVTSINIGYQQNIS